MYQVMAQLDDGEFLIVAYRDNLEEAAELIEGLNSYWPREYLVCDSQGNEVDLTTYTVTGPERRTALSFR